MLLAALLNFLVWLVVLPPLHPFDEAQHFLYARDLSRQPQWRWGFETQAPEEMMWLAEWTALKTPPLVRRSPWEAHSYWTRLETLASQDGGVLESDPYLRCLTHAPFRHYQPPLYYGLCAPVHALLAGQSIVIRLLAQRLVSVALGLLGVFLAFRIGRHIWEGDSHLGWCLAATMAFQPNYAFFCAAANNELLEVVLAEIVLLWTLQTLRSGFQPAACRRLGLVLGLGLLTRISFVAIWLATLASLVRPLGKSRQAWFYLVAVPLLLAGGWYLPLFQGEANALSSYYVEGTFDPTYSAPLWSPWRYLGQFLWNRWLWLGLGYWVGPFSFDFGWRPVGLMQASVVAMSLGACLLVVLALKQKLKRPDWQALAWPTLALVLFLQAMDYLLVRGAGQGFFIIRSQYLLPGLVGQLAWVFSGFFVLTRRTGKGATWLVLGAVWTNGQALLRTLHLGWGPGPVDHLLEPAARLWWLSSDFLAGLGAVHLAVALLLVAVLLAGQKTPLKAENDPIGEEPPPPA